MNSIASLRHTGIVLAAAMIALAAIVACDDESSNGATTTVGPTAAPTIVNSSPTVSTSCNLPGVACDVVAEYATWLQAGADEVLRHTQVVDVTCTDETFVDVDPDLCAGAEPGERREAIRVGDIAHLPLTAPSSLLLTVDADNAAQDQYGSGAHRIARVGCRDGDGCTNEISVIDTHISASEETRIVRLVVLVLDADSARWLIASFQIIVLLDTLHDTALLGTPPAEEGTPGGLGAYTFYDWPEMP